jgi:PAS domain S-box-containing protein
MLSAVRRPGSEYQTSWAPSFEAGLEALRADEHDAYLVDYLLDDGDGLDLVRHARALGVEAPLIMLTGKGSRAVDVGAMEAGASDYLVKGEINPDSLERTLRYSLQRLRDQRALRESEARHRSMFDHLPIGLYRCAPDGAFMDANPALVRMLGDPGPRELQERYARHFYVAPSDQESFLAILEREGVVRAFLTTLERGDGSHLRVRNTTRTHRGDGGRVEYLEGAVEDVSDEEASARIHEQARELGVVFESSRLAILRAKLDGTILEVNPAFVRAFGVDPTEMAGRTVGDLAADPDRSALESAVTALARGARRPLREERRFRAGDGSLLWARLHGERVEGEKAGAGHLVLLFEEIAEAGVPGL